MDKRINFNEDEQAKTSPQCNPVIVTSRPAKAEKIEVISNGTLKLRLSDGSEKEIVIKPTNISLYPDYRDQFGAPCVILNWAVFW